MKILLVTLLLSATFAYSADSPDVRVQGAGGKWYSAPELVQIAKDDAKKKKLDFNFERSGQSVSIYTNGSNTLARVVFMTGGIGSRACLVDIDRHGGVITNVVATVHEAINGRVLGHPIK